MKKKTIACIIASIVAISLGSNTGLTVSASEVIATARGMNYYVDSENGNDANDGISQQSPWKSLEKVNATTFLAGNTIYFKAGGTWSGMLQPKGSGSSDADITIDMYGEGNKPLIKGEGEEAAVKLDGQEYWTISNLEVTNEAEERGIRQGIFVYGKEDGITNGITIKNCEVHDVTGENRRSMDTYESMYWNSGIYVSMPGRSTATTHFNDVLIQDNYVHDVLTSGIRINQREDFIVDQYHTNVLIEGNTISRTGSDGMIVANCVSPLIQYNLCYDAGKLGNSDETKIIAGLWTCGTDDATFQYNEVARTILFESDGTAFDTDWGTGGITTFQYNYTHGNQGGFWLDCAGINKDSEHEKTVLRYNVSVDDEKYLVRAGDQPTEIYNNTFYKSTGKLDACFGNEGTKHKFWNNIFSFQETPDWASSTYENNLYYPCDPCPTDDSAITEDPLLVNACAAQDGYEFADNFKILDTSPCVNTAMYIEDNGEQDFWGNELNKGSYDIGACQTSVTKSSNQNTFMFARDFSTIQGNNNWYYMSLANSQYTQMSWDENQKKWKGTNTYNLIWAPGKVHPDSADTVIAWKAPKDGTVQIVGDPKKVDTGNDGINVKIVKNSDQVWPENGWQLISGSDTIGVSHDFTVDVVKNDMIYFVVNKNSTTYNDGSYWNPRITYDVVEQYNLTKDFSNKQGYKNWQYLEYDGTNYKQMTWDSSVSRWKGTNQYSLIWSPAQFHPDQNDTVLAWTAPHDGTILMTGNPKKTNLGYDGVNVKIMKDAIQVWPDSGWQFIDGRNSTGISYSVQTQVIKDQRLYFVLNQNNNNYSDEINWCPNIVYK
ncbi:MAG: right-handed parallel beta-helix repeat-containing protein [Lachnotalea sp.]